MNEFKEQLRKLIEYDKSEACLYKSENTSLKINKFPYSISIIAKSNNTTYGIQFSTKDIEIMQYWYEDSKNNAAGNSTQLKNELITKIELNILSIISSVENDYNTYTVSSTDLHDALYGLNSTHINNYKEINTEKPYWI
jgi:hypothetical protein